MSDHKYTLCKIVIKQRKKKLSDKGGISESGFPMF